MPPELLNIFLLSLCLGSGQNDHACQAAYNKFSEQNPEVKEVMKEAEKTYYDPLDNYEKAPLGAAGILVKRELRFGIYKGLFVDIRDQGRYQLGLKVTFP